MKINQLRNKVIEYTKLGLPIEKRKLIQQKLGYTESSKLLQDAIPLIKKDAFSPLRIEKIENTLYLCLITFINKRNSFCQISSELNTKCIQNTIKALKNLKNIKQNKATNNYFYEKINKSTKLEVINLNEITQIIKNWNTNGITQPSNPSQTKKYYKITENNNPIAIFSLDENFLTYHFNDFMIAPDKRKTKSVLDIIKLMRTTIEKQKTVTCFVREKQPELVKMYRKLGFEINAIYSELNTNNEPATIFSMIGNKVQKAIIAE